MERTSRRKPGSYGRSYECSGAGKAGWRRLIPQHDPSRRADHVLKLGLPFRVHHVFDPVCLAANREPRAHRYFDPSAAGKTEMRSDFGGARYRRRRRKLRIDLNGFAIPLRYREQADSRRGDSVQYSARHHSRKRSKVPVRGHNGWSGHDRKNLVTDSQLRVVVPRAIDRPTQPAVRSIGKFGN